MIIKFSCSFFFFLIFISCAKKEAQKNIYYLTNNSEKYWLLVREHPIHWYSGQCFNINGKLISFSVENKTGRRLIIENYDKPQWRFLNDSTLELESKIFKIIYLNEEILILNNLSFREVIAYKKSKDQLTKPVPDTTNYPFPSL